MSKPSLLFGLSPRGPRATLLFVACAAVLGVGALGCERVGLTPGDECELNSNCTAPLVCRIGRCRIECRAQRDCPVGLECVRDSAMLGACQVRDETECTLSSECRDNLVCRFGRCTNQCEEDVDCPPGAQCLADDDGMLGCRDGFERQCTFDSQCADRLICAVDNRCRPECREDRDCREGLVCLPAGGLLVCDFPPLGLDGGVPDGGPPPDGAVPDAGDAGVAAVVPPPFPRVAAGYDHTCAAVSASDFICWGANTRGQIGNGSLASAPTPFRVASLTGVQVVGAGNGHTCAATTAGVWCWGDNSTGQVGAGAGGSANYLTPNPVSGLPTPVTDLALGDAHTCAIANSRLFCWGDNSSGQLGNGGGANQPAPVDITAGLGGIPIEVSSFTNQTCVRLDTGRLQCFGANDRGQLGNGSAELTSTSPVDVVGITDAVQVATGNAHSCALRATGQILCWGDNILGELGIGSLDTARHQVPAPTLPPSSLPRQLALGSTHTCVRTDSGVECWGDNANHQCGSDNVAMMDRMITSPRVVVGIDSADEVATGSFHTCVRSGAMVSCFGTNADGQLGDGSAVASSFSPVTVSWP